MTWETSGAKKFDTNCRHPFVLGNILFCHSFPHFRNDRDPVSLIHLSHGWRRGRSRRRRRTHNNFKRGTDETRYSINPSSSSGFECLIKITQGRIRIISSHRVGRRSADIYQRPWSPGRSSAVFVFLSDFGETLRWPQINYLKYQITLLGVFITFSSGN